MTRAHRGHATEGSMLTRPSGHRSRGQALAEFAIVFPVFMLLLGGLIQFGIIFWGQNTLTQVVRDTGRWAATQKDCGSVAGKTFAQRVVATADTVAKESSLIGYKGGSMSDGSVKVDFSAASGVPCPPTSNTQERWVTVRINHTVPVFFPWIPGSGKLTSEARFRMEPCAGTGCRP